MANDSKSNLSLTNKNRDTIPMRIEFIRDLLNSNNIENIIMSECNSIVNDDSYDIRKVLNKKNIDFNKIINKIGGKLLYIKSGTTGHTFKGIVKNDNSDILYNYAVKVSAYPKKEKYGNINDTRRPENAELMMLKLLSSFVIKGKTPHIVLPIIICNTKIDPFINDICLSEKKNKKYMEFINKYKNGEYSDTVSILISEWANRGDLLDFLKNNYRKLKLVDWKVIFFQIIATLAVIQSKYPSFRHNDLKANNILIHKITTNTDYFSYKILRLKYCVPNIGYQIKLWDFDFSCIPGIIDNAKVCADWTTHINVNPEQNRYYDLHYFFNTLIKRGFLPQILEDECISSEVKDFIDRVLPLKFRMNYKYVHKRGRILINNEFITPNDILKNDPFFECFRICNKQTKNINMENLNIDDIDYLFNI